MKLAWINHRFELPNAFSWKEKVFWFILHWFCSTEPIKTLSLLVLIMAWQQAIACTNDDQDLWTEMPSLYNHCSSLETILHETVPQGQAPCETRTTRMNACFWGYPLPPDDNPYYWVILDPKSEEDKVKATNLKNSPKIFEFETNITRDTPS